MFPRMMTIAAATGVLLFAGVTPGLAQKKPAKCSSILAICLQRAEGHAAICEDMYKVALSNQQWQATEEPDGTKHPAVPCTR